MTKAEIKKEVFLKENILTCHLSFTDLSVAQSCKVCPYTGIVFSLSLCERAMYPKLITPLASPQPHQTPPNPSQSNPTLSCLFWGSFYLNVCVLHIVTISWNSILYLKFSQKPLSTLNL